MPEWIISGAGVLLLLYGALTGIANWCIFFYNIAHCYIIRDGKHSSFIPLIPAVCLVSGGILAEPLIPGAGVLILLDGELVLLLYPLALLLYLIPVVIFRALRWVLRKVGE